MSFQALATPSTQWKSAARRTWPANYMQYDGVPTRKAKELAATFLRKHLGR
ncbi:MAG: hypothetical protein ACREB6_14370 [Rhodospirillales bacterium]